MIVEQDQEGTEAREIDPEDHLELQVVLIDSQKRYKRVQAREPSPEEEDKEELVVLYAYAISCPWTVMVEAEHTGIAFRAVVGPRGSVLLALVAVGVLDVLPHKPVKALLYQTDIYHLFCLFLSRS